MNQKAEERPFGGLHLPSKRPEVKPLLGSTPDRSFPSPTFNWSEYALTADDQGRMNTCETRSAMGYLEMHHRRYLGRDCIPKGMQLWDEEVYWTARRMFFPDSPDVDAGLYLGNSFHAMIEMGILPPGTKVRKIELNAYAIAEQLQKTPIVQGHIFHKGWFHLSPQGQIGENYEHHPSMGGHATVGMQRLEKDSTQYILSQNSHSEEKGFHGYVLMTEEEYAETVMDNPVVIDLPKGWEDHRGWEKLIIEKEAA